MQGLIGPKYNSTISSQQYKKKCLILLYPTHRHTPANADCGENKVFKVVQNST